MAAQNIFIWNARGLNMSARRAVVREFLSQERVSVVCLVETKLSDLCIAWANELLGMAFDYVCLPSMGASGGIVVAWRREDWLVSAHACHAYSVTVTIVGSSSPGSPWTLAAVYGPVLEELKGAFLDELRQVHSMAVGPLLICGDFNLIYQAADKNNSRLNLRSMRRFRRLIDDLHLQELYLNGRLYPGRTNSADLHSSTLIVLLQQSHGLRNSPVTTSGVCRPTVRTTRRCCYTFAHSHGQSLGSTLSLSGCAWMASKKRCIRLGMLSCLVSTCAGCSTKN